MTQTKVQAIQDTIEQLSKPANELRSKLSFIAKDRYVAWSTRDGVRLQTGDKDIGPEDAVRLGQWLVEMFSPVEPTP